LAGETPLELEVDLATSCVAGKVKVGQGESAVRNCDGWTIPRRASPERGATCCPIFSGTYREQFFGDDPQRQASDDRRFAKNGDCKRIKPAAILHRRGCRIDRAELVASVT